MKACYGGQMSNEQRAVSWGGEDGTHWDRWVNRGLSWGSAPQTSDVKSG